MTTFNRLWCRLSRLYVPELIIGAVWLSFGAILLYQPVNSFASSTAYRIIALVADEDHWGVAFAALGLFVFIASFTGIHWIRRVAMFTSAVAMTVLDVSFFFSAVTGAAGTYAVLGVTSLWCYFRLVKRPKEQCE